jgi:hypothetical protein
VTREAEIHIENCLRRSAGGDQMGLARSAAQRVFSKLLFGAPITGIPAHLLRAFIRARGGFV